MLNVETFLGTVISEEDITNIKKLIQLKSILQKSHNLLLYVKYHGYRRVSRKKITSLEHVEMISTFHFITVEPVLRDHCHERPPVLTDHTFLAERPIFQYN